MKERRRKDREKLKEEERRIGRWKESGEKKGRVNGKRKKEGTGIFWILASVRTGSLFRDNSSFSSELTITFLI